MSLLVFWDRLAEEDADLCSSIKKLVRYHLEHPLIFSGRSQQKIFIAP